MVGSENHSRSDFFQATFGNRIVTVVPLPGILAISIEPPCSSTHFCTTTKPKPVPAM
ncbi:unknown protein [Microcystis aeruginosa NIES-843]|uniref:Uncharacterized protein n=1 Tax=Microcystis aeruginosa (strain NIES-843 / IAM M-2473) TaxID=449447 RepID=B0JH24_MICAN|nr:unknown protein [Microcystis aeruginosa NIES-843]